MENTKNKIGITFLIIILLAFVVGGYIFMQYMINNNDEPEAEDDEPKIDARIDATKDYVYYENSEEISDDIYIEDVILNFKGLEKINESLHESLIELTREKVPLSDVKDAVCDGEYYSFQYREYTYTKFASYVSVVMVDYDYNCVSGSKPKKIMSYVIDKNSGKVISDNELLKKFNVNEELLLKSVKDRLEFTQTLTDDNDEVIDIDATIDNYKATHYGEGKALSISKNGKIMVNFIVKSNKINYNDSVEIELKEN